MLMLTELFSKMRNGVSKKKKSKTKKVQFFGKWDPQWARGKFPKEFPKDFPKEFPKEFLKKS